MRWALGIGAIVLAAALAAGWVLGRDRIAMALLERGAAEAMAPPALDRLDAGLHAAFCGTGSPLPDRNRAGPCLAVVADGRLFVFDAGEGAAETLSLMGLPPGRVEAVFLTHLHSDHIDGLGALMLQRWAGASAETQLTLIGPPGVERIAAGLGETYALDSGYRIAHHGPETVPPSGYGFAPFRFEPPRDGEIATVYESGGVRVRAFSVDHAPVEPAVGYRIEAGDRSLVVSGDTARSDLVFAAKGADLLVHDALAPNLTRVIGKAAANAGQAGLAKIFRDIEDYHATPAEAAALARDAGVRALALTHQVPPLRMRIMEGAFVGGADETFQGPLIVARDGDLVSISADGAIARSNLLD